jgi:sugar phosphate isomerase/epimerase
MKVSMFTGIFKGRPLEEAAKEAAKIGYDGLELQARSHIPPETTREGIARIKDTVTAHGLEVPVIYSNLSGGYARGKTEESRKKADLIERYAEWASEIGASMICHSPGGPAPDQAEEGDYERAAEWISRVAETLTRYRIKLIMEIHHGGLVETVDSSLRLMSHIPLENVGLILDPGNMAIAGDDYGEEAVQRLGNRLFHVHSKDVQFFDSKPAGRPTGEYKGRIFAVELMGQGSVDHRPAYQALIRNGYAGYVSLEAQPAGEDSYRIALHEYTMFKKSTQL